MKLSYFLYNNMLSLRPRKDSKEFWENPRFKRPCMRDRVEKPRKRDRRK